MIFITIFFMAILTLIQYFGLQGYLMIILDQPIEYHLTFLALLLVVRLGIALYKVLPALRGFYRSLSRITSKIELLSNKLDKQNNSNSPFSNGGQKRELSTSSRVNLKKLNSNPLPKKEGDRKSIVSPKLPVKSKMGQLLTSRRIKGLFASIVENGSLVSLGTSWQPVKDGRFDSIDAAKAAAKELQSKGILTKVITSKTKDKFTVYQQLHGTVSDLISAFGWRIISLAFPNKVKFAGRLRLLSLFSNYIWRIYRTNGSQQTVKFLKAGQLAIQKSIAKDKITSLRELDKDLVRTRLTSSGLPTIIPSRDRKLIAGGAEPIIRFWLTLFAIYRVISIPGQLKLATIVNPLSVSLDTYSKVANTFDEFLSSSKVSSMFEVGIMTKEADILLFEAASATQKVAWTGLFSDPKLLSSVGLATYLRKILQMLDQGKLLNLFDSLVDLNKSEYIRPHLSPVLGGDGPFSHSVIADPEGFYCGKLALKEEAAGKLRVFAMTDIWTQQVLKPIEKMLATFLKSLPTDGVYDQHASEMRARSKSIQYGCAYGYDLSAATDRLPIGLQEAVLNQIIPFLGDNWGAFLTMRDYYLYLPDSFAKEIGATKDTMRAKAPNSCVIGDMNIPIYYNSKGKPWVRLTYSVGQPMGALSSFAMLAVTHHLIVQLAYRNAYAVPISKTWEDDAWFSGYECTGDDVIIFDRLVAAEYLKLMESFGVPINTTKSVVAQVPATEYLKVTSLNGVNVGAISWKMLMSGNSLMGRANILFFFLSKGIIHKNINPWIERSARPTFHKPGLLSPTLLAIWTMLSNRGLITVGDALKSLIDGKQTTFRLAKAILLNANVKMIQQSIPSIFAKGVYNRIPNRKVEFIWKFEQPWFEHKLYSPLAVFLAKHNVGEDSNALSKAMFNIMIQKANFGFSESNNISTFLDSLSADHVLDYGVEELPSYQINIPDKAVFHNDMSILFWSLEAYMADKLGHISERIISSDPNWGSSTLGQLAESNDDLARYNELCELVTRYQDKIDPDKDVAPPRNIRATELKLIKLLRGMGNRPLFTTAKAALGKWSPSYSTVKFI
nr:putative RNA-dependent RNA polymerase [Rhizoctonia solani mitovirus 105]